MGDVGSVGHVAFLVARGGDDAPDRQPELEGELVVALVMGRDGHDRAGPVAAEDVVRDEDRDPLAVDGVDRVGADRDAGLLPFRREPVDLGPVRRLGDVRLDLGTSIRRRQLGDERVLRGQDHERRPEERVRPGREHPQLGAAGVMPGRCGLEDDLAALAPPDPVRLHHPDRLREVDPGEVEQLVGVLRDAQIPLRQVALLDLGAAPPAVAVGAFDLFAGERPVVRAPVDRRGLAVGEAGLEEAQEQPLVPAVVRRVGGDDLRLPVKGRTHRPQLPPHVLDVAHRPITRVDVVLDRGVLGR